MTELDFKPKRLLKHKDHLTLNEGESFDTQVQHLKINDDGEFVELKDNEAAKKYGSKKLLRDLDFKSRDGLQSHQDSGLGKTPDWFPRIISSIPWDDYRTLLYEMDHLWLNMFFVRELYGEEKTGREQILSLEQSNSEEDSGLILNVLAQIDYSGKDGDQSYDNSLIDGYIRVEIVEEEIRESNGKGMDVDAEYRQTVFDEDEQNISSALREMLTGICLKHDYRGEQLHFKIERLPDNEFKAEILNKDFSVRFSEDLELQTGISQWVVELLQWDGCPLNMENIEVTNK